MAEKDTWQKVKASFGKDNLKLGPRFTYKVMQTPRQLVFHYSRYKFAARLIGETPAEILELGCSEGLHTLLLAEGSHKVTAVDFDDEAIKWAKANIKNSNISFITDNFIGKTYGHFDSVVAAA